MLKPDLIEFKPKTLAKAEDVNYNFEQMSDYVFGTAKELSALVQSAVANMTLQLQQSVFTGKIEMYAGNADNIPLGWLLCDGSAVSREEYQNLYNAIGTKYGAGNGATTFNLPNYIGRFLEGGTTAGTKKDAALPNIKASFSARSDFSTQSGPTGAVTTSQWFSGHAGGALSGTQYNFDASRSSSIYKNGVNTVQPPSVTVLYIIKT